MKINSFHLPFFWAFSLFAAYVVGGRDKSVGSDTENYVSIFSEYMSGQELRFEKGFELLVNFSHYLNVSVEYFFAIIFLIVFYSFVYVLHTVQPVVLKRNFSIFPFAIVAFVLLSDWFFVATTNSLRQGVALAFLYVFFVCVIYGKKLSSLFFLVASCSFHFSIIMFIPFLFLYFVFDWRQVGIDFLFVLNIFLGFLFYLGFLEWLVFSISDWLGVPFYAMIKLYSANDPRWVGFNILFYLYVLFFVGLPWLLYKIKLMSVDDTLLSVLRFYTALALVYYFFGFAAYSNRYAFFAWLFSPVVSYAIYCRVNINSSIRQVFSVFLFFFSCVYFFSYFMV